MAKTKKPSGDALRTEARSQMAEMPADLAGARLDDTADMVDLDDLDMPDEVERAMQEKMGDEPDRNPQQ